MPIETGRWIGLAREDRLCTLCNSNEIGTEFHYMYVCQNSQVVKMREKFIPKYFYKYPSETKMKGHLQICNVNVLKNLSVFIKYLKRFF